MRVAAVAWAGLAAACGGEAPPTEPAPPPSMPTRAPDPLTATAHVDEDGYFEISDPSIVEAYSASPRVRSLVGRLGWIDTAAPESPRIAVRVADGSFETRTLVEQPANGALRDRVFAALLRRATSWGAERTPGAFARFLAAAVGPAPSTEPTLLPIAIPERGASPSHPLTERLAGSPVPSEPGADLAAWAPAERPFARFRSVEAAGRFAAEADRLAARLLAAEGDGRDWGTLRWALHDLLLPTIWRTNPGGETGVGECAVVFETPMTRGRSEVALLLRITDAENHRMDTLAGIGQESRPDHLWRPERDPTPGIRDRRNFREVRADVEWVATSEAAMAALRSTSVERLATDPGWRAARGGAPPPREEAMFLFVPERVRALGGADRGVAWDLAARKAREDDGLAALIATWAGDRFVEFRRPDLAEVRPQGTPLLARLVSARATTDVKGALVEATFVDEPSARAAEESLAAAARPLPNAGDVCRTNLCDLVPLAVCENVPAQDVAERSFVVLGWKPVCPCGGTYLVHPVTRETSCTLHGSVRKPLPEGAISTAVTVVA